MKKFKTLILVIIFAITFPSVFLACTTGNYLVPGYDTIKIQSVYNEYFTIAEEYYSLGKYDKALMYYEKCSSNKKLKNECQYKKALCYVQLKDWKKAEEIFSKLLSIDSDNSTLKSSLAYTYSMEGDTDKSLSLYKELVETHPENQSFLENYISVLIQKEIIDEVKVQFENLKKNFSDSKKIPVIEEKLESYKTAEESSDE